MTDLPIAARRYLDAKNRENNRYWAQELKKRQEEERKRQEEQEKEKRLRDERIKESVLRGEESGCGPYVCWTITTIVLLCIPIVGWFALIALYAPCNCYIAHKNRIRVLEAASKGSRALKELSDLDECLSTTF